MITFLKFDFLRRYFYSKKKYNTSFYLSLINLIFFLLISLFFYRADLIDNIYIFMIINALSNLISIFVVAFISKEISLFYFPRFSELVKKNLQFIRDNIKYTKHVLSSSFLRGLSENIFYYFCSYYLPLAEVSAIRLFKNFYALCHPIFRALNVFYMTLHSSRKLKNSLRELFNQTNLICLYYLIVCFLIFLIINFFIDDLVILLYGPKLLQFVDAFYFWFIVYIFTALYFPLSIYFTKINNTKILSLSSFTMVILSMLSYLFIKIFNYQGALISLLLIFMIPTIIVMIFYFTSNYKLSKII